MSIATTVLGQTSITPSLGFSKAYIPAPERADKIYHFRLKNEFSQSSSLQFGCSVEQKLTDITSFSLGLFYSKQQNNFKYVCVHYDSPCGIAPPESGDIRYNLYQISSSAKVRIWKNLGLQASLDIAILSKYEFYITHSGGRGLANEIKEPFSRYGVIGGLFYQ